MPERTEREIAFSIGGVVILAIIGIMVIIALFSSFYTVDAGQRAIVLRFGEPHPEAYDSGLHFKVPFIEEVVKMDVKTLKYEAAASAASQDLQTVSTNVALNYHLSPDSVVTLYSEIGLDYSDKIIQPAVQEVVKAATAKYTAEQLISKRPEVKEAIDTALRDRLGKLNIIVDTVSITNFDFSPSFNAAIEAKVTAEQNALAEKNKVAQIEYIAKQKVAEAEGTKQAAILEAQGKAEAIRIQTEAIKAQGGAEYVQLQAIAKWDGSVPMYTGSGAVPFINIAPTTSTTK